MSNRARKGKLNHMLTVWGKWHFFELSCSKHIQGIINKVLKWH